MRLRRAFLWLCLLFASGHAGAAVLGIVTLVEGGPRMLRGTTWYKLGTGVRLEEADIVAAPERAQLQIEFFAGTLVSFVGPGMLYFAAAPAKAGAQPAMLTGGWLKVAAKAPGLRIRMPPFDAVVADAIVVVHAEGAATAVFVESGAASVLEVAANGQDGPPREAKRGEYWAKSGSAAFTTAGSPPRALVGAMPRQFADPLPELAPRVKPAPLPAAAGEVTYAEADPWLSGRDRVAFEKRFVTRLRDPVFRKAAEPDLARHPAWDRIVHPEKYLPKEAPAK